MAGLRQALLWGLLTLTSAGWLALVLWAGPRTQLLLLLMFGAVVVGVAAVTWHYRARMTVRLFTANLVLGSIVHVAVAGAVVAASRLAAEGFIPGLARDWQAFLVGVLGLGAAYLTWTRARTRPVKEKVVAPPASEVEPPPPASAELDQEPDWEDLGAMLEIHGDAPRLRQLQVLRRLWRASEGKGPADERLVDVRRTLHQEAQRLGTRSTAAQREASEEDVLSQAAALLDWGVQKLPELGQLDLSDLLMAKAISDIRSLHSHVERRFVDHRALLPIHPIDRDTAEARCEERAAAAREALPLLRANGMRLSEDLISAEPALAAFASVTGFQVVDLGEDAGFVTFEGNGRREALQRAFGEAEAVEVEVRVYRFADEATLRTIQRRVRRVMRWKEVAGF